MVNLIKGDPKIRSKMIYDQRFPRRMMFKFQIEAKMHPFANAKGNSKTLPSASPFQRAISRAGLKIGKCDSIIELTECAPFKQLSQRSSFRTNFELFLFWDVVFCVRKSCYGITTVRARPIL